MTEAPLFTLEQGLQLLALGPCFFLLFALPLALRDWKQVIVPWGFFASLAASLAVPLAIALEKASGAGWHGFFSALQWYIAPFTLLLVLQVVRQQTPPKLAWLVLLLPIAIWLWIGPPFTLVLDGHCLYDLCIIDERVQRIATIVMNAAILLLLLVLLQRASHWSHLQRDPDNRFWVVIALLGILLAVGAVQLLALDGRVPLESAALADTLLKMTFLYVVLTLLFRVQQEHFALHMGRVPTAARYMQPSEADELLVRRLETLLASEKLYEETRLSRAQLAKKLGTTEHALSHAINRSSDENLSQSINRHRCEAAKERLRSEATQVTLIAYDVGFNSLATFNRVFKEREGMTPTDYRKAFKAS